MQQTGSFIPSQTKRMSGSSVKTKRIYIFSYISYVLFFGTLLAVIGLFLYELQLNRQLENQKQLLAEQRENFSQSDLVRVRDIEMRMQRALSLLDGHGAVSLVLQELNRTTLENIQLENLKIERSLAGDFYRLAVGGQTETFDALIFQDQILASAAGDVSYSLDGVSYGQEVDPDSESPAEDQAQLPVTFMLEKIIPVSAVAYTGTTVTTPVAPAPAADAADVGTSTDPVTDEPDVSSNEPTE